MIVNVDMSESGVYTGTRVHPGWGKNGKCKIVNKAVTCINTIKLTFLGARELQPGVYIVPLYTPGRGFAAARKSAGRTRILILSHVTGPA